MQLVCLCLDVTRMQDIGTDVMVQAIEIETCRARLVGILLADPVERIDHYISRS